MLSVSMFFTVKRLLTVLLMTTFLVTLPAQAGVLEWLGLSSPATPKTNTHFLSVEQAFVLGSNQGADSLQLTFDIEPGYYLYRHTLAAFATNAQIGDWTLPEGTPHEDEYFGKTQVYYRQLTLNIPLQNVEKDGLVEVRYQGCTTGLCYPPQTRQLAVTPQL